jgi:hypothetical protein
MSATVKENGTKDRPLNTLADQGHRLILDQIRSPRVVVARRKSRHHPDRLIRRPNRSASASEVIAPPWKTATTRRPSTGANPNKSLLHSASIEGFAKQ